MTGLVINEGGKPSRLSPGGAPNAEATDDNEFALDPKDGITLPAPMSPTAVEPKVNPVHAGW